MVSWVPWLCLYKAFSSGEIRPRNAFQYYLCLQVTETLRVKGWNFNYVNWNGKCEERSIILPRIKSLKTRRFYKREKEKPAIVAGAEKRLRLCQVRKTSEILKFSVKESSTQWLRRARMDCVGSSETLNSNKTINPLCLYCCLKYYIFIYRKKTAK